MQRVWALMGIFPFTRKPLWDLKKKNEAAARSKVEYSDEDKEKASGNLVGALQSMLDPAGKASASKKRKGRVGAGQVWASESGIATSDAWAAKLEEQEKEKEKEAQRVAVSREKAAAGRAKAEKEEQELASQLFSQYEEANLKVDRLPSGALTVKAMKAVLLHKLSYPRPAKLKDLPADKAAWTAALTTQLSKDEVVAPLRAAYQARQSN